MKSLADYDISETRGFLSRFNADEVILEGLWAEARQVAMRLPQTLPTGRVRELLKTQLPEFDAETQQWPECGRNFCRNRRSNHHGASDTNNSPCIQLVQ